jgi:uncharacterized protein (DUF58 family)
MNSGEFHYKVAWRATSSYPGHHASQHTGGGLLFSNHAALIDAPDPRRFDVRASLRDPFEQVQVRVYRQTSSIPVYAIADLSASMRFDGHALKMHVLADFISCLAYSAYRTGDRFGFVGCGTDAAQRWLVPATRHRATGLELAERLRSYTPEATNSNGLLDAAELLGPRRALVFLVSDFHVPSTLLAGVLDSLALHDVVPVMLWDRNEYEKLPNYGIAELRCLETQKARLVVMRPSLKKRILQAFQERRETLSQLFAHYGRAPLLLEDGFNADQVTEYFFG